MVEKCPKGMIKRKGYTSNRDGKKVRVSASCIKARSATGSKRTPKDKAYVKKREKIQKKMKKKFGSKKCPSGKIERAGYTKKAYSRKAYTRKDGTRVSASKVSRAEVAPACIKDQGKPGKGKKIPVHLKKGALEKFGYDDVVNMTKKERHTALKKAYNSNKKGLSLFRKLIYVSTLNKDTNPKVSKIFRDDAEWVRENFMDKKSTKRKSGSKSKKFSKSKSKSKKESAKKKSKKSSKSKSKSMKGGAKKKSKTGSKSNKSKKTKSGSKSKTGSKSKKSKSNKSKKTKSGSKSKKSKKY